MAVSKALRNHADIRAETKARVLRRAAELNYRVDWVARSLRAGRSYLVGLVLPDLMQSFFAEIATAVAETLAPAGYHVLISHTRESAEEEIKNLDLLIARKVDGLIIASAQRSGRLLKRLTTPYVLIDRKLSEVPANFVGSENEQVGRIATEHLIEQGCRRIAHLTGPKVSSAAGRLAGYRSALRKHGLKARENLIVPAGHDDEAGYVAMRKLLTRQPHVDGVFCFNDPAAVGAMRAILEEGLTIPGDISLIGVANMHYSDLLSVPLSTVDQDTARIGKVAAERLLECMKGGGLKAKSLLVPPHLIVRASSRRPRA